MYCISDEQIDFIINDIRARGVTLEDLRQNLLDHICILIENELEEQGDFERCYLSVIKTFYKQELQEIEEEAIFLLTRKKNNAMKQTMIISGTFSVAAFIGSSFCKIFGSNLTDFLMFLGFISFVFLFLPLLYMIKFRENPIKQDRLILTSGTIAGLLYFFCMLLKFLGPGWPKYLGNAWPHLDIIWLALWLLALAIGLFVFIPVYFLSGIRKPETKTNTIAICVLLVGFILIQFRFTNLMPLRQAKQTTSVVSPKQSPMATALR